MHFVICGKYRKFKKPKISIICDKTLLLCSICSKCGSEDQKMFKDEEEEIKMIKFLGLITNIEYEKINNLV